MQYNLFHYLTANTLLLSTINGAGMYSAIDDVQLDELVVSAVNQHPGIGIRMLKGFLQSKGFRIQRERIRMSLLRIDPIGLMERWRSTVKRRCYNVKYPLSLWHIDGHHKLIRYLIFINVSVVQDLVFQMRTNEKNQESYVFPVLICPIQVLFFLKLLKKKCRV